MVLKTTTSGLKNPSLMPDSIAPVVVENGKLHTSRKILIIEDDPDSLDLLVQCCTKEGFMVGTAGDGEDGLVAFEVQQPDLILLDLLLPGMGGLEVCRRIRTTSDKPIIVVTAKREEVDKLLALETGADDYITKPFSPRELMARIRLILRRFERSLVEKPLEPEFTLPALETKRLATGRLQIDLDSREVSYSGQPLTNLTRIEYDLLVHLAQHPGRIYSATELKEALYGINHLVESRVISVHISKLRNKLPNPDLIVTVYGTGYKLLRESE